MRCLFLEAAALPPFSTGPTQMHGCIEFFPHQAKARRLGNTSIQMLSKSNHARKSQEKGSAKGQGIVQ
jgi:hypothetical protein